MSPSPRAVLAVAAVAVSALLLPAGLVVLGFVVIVAATVADAWAVRRPPLLVRSVPRILARGVAAPLLVSPEEGEAPRVLRIRQPAPPALAVAPDETGDGVGTSLDAVIRGLRRGRHVLPKVAVRSTGPLGLGRWDHEAAEAMELVVYPDLPAARALATAVRTGQARDLAVLTRGALGLGTELERVREYLPDDDLRQVNWKATARLGRPMSNEYRLDQDRDVICVVDAGRLMAAPLGASLPGGSATRLDAALDATTAVVLVADVVGDRCGAVAFDARVLRRVAPRRQGGRAVVDALFDLEPSSVDSDHLAAFRAVVGGKRACVVVFTDLVDVAAARTLVEAVPVLSRRHAVVVASVTDEDLVGLLRRPPATPLDVYAAAVAVDVLDARAEAAERLRAVGAVVIEAPAHALGRACVAAYLRLKARARL